MSDVLDLAIVGAGPAGLNAASHASANALECVVIERADHIADTVYSYQARKHVMAEPSLVPQRGSLPFEAGSRESILEAWEAHRRDSDLEIVLGQEVDSISRGDDGIFTIRSAGGSSWRAANVILAMGTQGALRKPGVPGENLPHVEYRLGDAADFMDEEIVVAGAGDSALEVALALADQNHVSLVVRSSEIVRAKESLTRDALSRQASGLIDIYFNSTLQQIQPTSVELLVRGVTVRLPADRLFIKIGADPPRRFLESLGVEYSGPGSSAQPILSRYHETSVPGMFLIGAASGRDLIKLGMNQGWEVVERILGRDVLPADEEVLRGKLPFLTGDVHERIAALRQQIPIFRAASSEQIREVLLATELREFQPGDRIIRQNDYTTDFMVIVEGRVDIFSEPEGDEPPKQLAELTSGNFFGEMSLISGRRRSATVVARTPTLILEIPRKSILKLIRVAPEVEHLIDQAFLLRALQGYLFRNVNSARLGELVADSELLELPKEHVVFNEGEGGDALYFIRRGMVKISRYSGDREIVLAYLVAGNFFGETALLSDSPRTATVTTIFPTDLIRLDKRNFERFMAKNPELRDIPISKLKERRLSSLIADATPGSGNILSDLIREEVVMGTDTLIIDEHLCVRCNNCISACEGVHDDGQARLSLSGIRMYNVLAPNSCWQCENPLCMLDCPPDAIVRDPRGEVYIKSNCIGCGNCEDNCPYGNIFMVHPKPKRNPLTWFTSLFRSDSIEASDQTVAVKCDLCRDISGGPACVRSCPTGAAIRLTPDEYRETFEEIIVTRGAS